MENNQNAVTGNEALQNAFNNFSEQLQNNAANGTGEPAGQETGKEPEVTPAQQEPDNSQSPANQAFAKLRTDNANMSNQLKALENAIKQQGYANVQDFLDKQAANQIQQQAQKQGISPELEKRIQSLEQENARYKQQERMANLKNEVGALVQKYNIDKAGWDNFIAQLTAANINPMTTNTPLETLYVQHNLEAIFNKRLEQEKQAWMQTQNNVNKNAPISTPQGTTPPANNLDSGKTAPNWKNMAKQFKESK